jgi:predicted NUDIX family phosphoesterase
MEQVFVVRRSDFFGGGWPQGWLPCPARAGEDLLARLAASGTFVDRETAERDPATKQLIPYCVVRQGDLVLCVQRKPAQGERRLHGRLSIGLGGHVNPGSDATGPGGLFHAALARELDEELTGAAALAPRFLGLCNDDRDEVGRVHAGLVYLADVPPGSRTPAVREISKMAGGFRSLADLGALWQDPARLESWSRILIEAGVAGDKAVSGQGGGALGRRDGREDSFHG